MDGVHDGHPDLGESYVIDLIQQCGDLGINFIDTAEQYGNGKCERRIAKAVNGRRNQWVISTKFGNLVGPNGERISDFSAKRIPISLEGSLRRLQTDYLDVYLYHANPSRDDALDGAEFLLDAKKRGLVRSVGVSSGDVAVCEHLLSLGCLDVVEFPKNLMKPAPAMSSFLERAPVGGIVRGAFYDGRLTGRYFHQAPALPPEDIRSRWLINKERERDYTKYVRFEEMVTAQRSMVQLALRFLLDELTTSTIILGAKSVDSYREAIKASECASLSAGELARIAEIKAELAGQ